MVGIQEELQIEREKELWILFQAPLEIKGLDFRIPFHNQEEEEVEMGERRAILEILTLQLCCPKRFCLCVKLLAKLGDEGQVNISHFPED